MRREGRKDWLYLEEPTPGKKNAVRSYRDRAPEPVIETEAGFYEGSVAVEISAPEGILRISAARTDRAARRFTCTFVTVV